MQTWKNREQSKLPTAEISISESQDNGKTWSGQIRIAKLNGNWDLDTKTLTFSRMSKKEEE